MEFAEVAALVGEVPHMPPEDGRIVYDFIRRSGVRDVLELGFAHGTSTCYMAAALAAGGGGRVVAIDNQSARTRSPSIHDLLARTDLAAYVQPVFADTSYNWELLRLIEAATMDGVCRPSFDFCFIDGAHSWETDGLAFFLAEKLLRPGGWILFDDLDWTYASSPTLAASEHVRSLPEDQRTTPQVERVWRLLAAQHPNIRLVRREATWGWARKGDDSPAALDATYLEQGIGRDVRSLVRKVKRRLFG